MPSRRLARSHPALAFPPPRSLSLPPMTDDEVQSGAAVLTDEPQPSPGVQGATCVDTRVGGAYVGRQVEADIRTAGLPGELSR